MKCRRCGVREARIDFHCLDCHAYLKLASLENAQNEMDAAGFHVELSELTPPPAEPSAEAADLASIAIGQEVQRALALAIDALAQKRVDEALKAASKVFPSEWGVR